MKKILIALIFMSSAYAGSLEVFIDKLDDMIDQSEQTAKKFYGQKKTAIKKKLSDGKSAEVIDFLGDLGGKIKDKTARVKIWSEFAKSCIADESQDMLDLVFEKNTYNQNFFKMLSSQDASGSVIAAYIAGILTGAIATKYLLQS